MSKAKSRGWSQVLARSSAANPHTTERSATQVIERRSHTEARDVTRMSEKVQIDALQRSVKRILISLERAVRLKRTETILNLTTLLANQRARIEILAKRLADKSKLEPIPLPRVIPDLTTDPMRYMPTAPMVQRFDQRYVNKGKVYRPSLDWLYE